MTIYTLMPLELVLSGIEQVEPSSTEIYVRGMLMEVKPVAPGFGQIVRLLSAPLPAYLDAKYMPGTIISYQLNQYHN